MPDGMRITIKGFDEMKAKLKRLGEEEAVRVVRAALIAGARPILNAARAMAPAVTGALRRSLGIVPLRRDWRQAVVLVKPRRPRGSKDKKRRSYAAFVEFGHRLGRRTAKIQRLQKAAASGNAAAKTRLQNEDVRTEVPAHPFLRPAFKSTRTMAEQIIREQIAVGIQKAAVR